MIDQHRTSLLKLLYVFFLCFLPFSAHADVDSGARLIKTTCIPDVPITNPDSCDARNITLDDYYVTVRFSPSPELVAMVTGSAMVTTGAVSGNYIPGVGVYSTIGITSIVTTAALATMIDYQLNPPEFEMRAWDNHTVGSLFFLPFEARLEGANVCFYLTPLGFFEIPIPKDTKEFVDKNGDLRDANLPRHCVEAPPPKARLLRPDWGRLISKACTNHCLPFDHDNNPFTARQGACFDHDKDGGKAYSWEQVNTQLIASIEANGTNRDLIEDNQVDFAAFAEVAEMGGYENDHSFWTLYRDYNCAVGQTSNLSTGNNAGSRGCTAPPPGTFDVKAAAANSDFPMTAVLMECIQETISNVMYRPVPATATNEPTPSFFQRVQKNFSYIVSLLLVLYIIVFGYRLIIEKGSLKKGEYMWMVVKIAAIVYFVSGPGMVDIFYMLPKAVQQIGYTIMNPFEYTDNLNTSYECKTFKIPDDGEGRLEEVDNPSITDRTVCLRKRLEQASRIASDRYETYVRERRGLFLKHSEHQNLAYQESIGITGIGDPNSFKNNQLKKQQDKEAESSLDLQIARDAEKKAAIEVNSIGYDYCSFGHTEFQQLQERREEVKVQYDRLSGDAKDQKGFELYLIDRRLSQSQYTNYNGKDMSYLRIWDTIDCRLAKYLGLGDNQSNRSVPQILVVGTTVFGSAVGLISGIVIFLWIIIFLVFILQLVIRTFHIFVFAFIALALLIYFSPLFIPAILFERTKSIFDKWLKQLISYSIQPIILFVFLALFFFVVDGIFYGKNQHFSPENLMQGVVPNSTSQTTIDPTTGKAMTVTTQPEYCDLRSAECECEDKDTIACIYYMVRFGDREVNEKSNDFALTKLQMSNAQAIVLVTDFFFIIVLCFLFHSVASQVEEMARTLTDATGGGIATMADAVKQSNPLETGQAFASTVDKLATFPAKGGKLVADKVKKARAKRAALKDETAFGSKGKLAGMGGSLREHGVMGTLGHALAKGGQAIEKGKHTLDEVSMGYTKKRAEAEKFMAKSSEEKKTAIKKKASKAVASTKKRAGQAKKDAQKAAIKAYEKDKVAQGVVAGAKAITSPKQSAKKVQRKAEEAGERAGKYVDKKGQNLKDWKQDKVRQAKKGQRVLSDKAHRGAAAIRSIPGHVADGTREAFVNAPKRAAKKVKRSAAAGWKSAKAAPGKAWKEAQKTPGRVVEGAKKAPAAIAHEAKKVPDAVKRGGKAAVKHGIKKPFKKYVARPIENAVMDYTDLQMRRLTNLGNSINASIHNAERAVNRMENKVENIKQGVKDVVADPGSAALNVSHAAISAAVNNVDKVSSKIDRNLNEAKIAYNEARYTKNEGYRNQAKRERDQGLKEAKTPEERLAVLKNFKENKERLKDNYKQRKECGEKMKHAFSVPMDDLDAQKSGKSETAMRQIDRSAMQVKALAAELDTVLKTADSDKSEEFLNSFASRAVRLAENLATLSAASLTGPTSDEQDDAFAKVNEICDNLERMKEEYPEQERLIEVTIELIADEAKEKVLERATQLAEAGLNKEVSLLEELKKGGDRKKIDEQQARVDEFIDVILHDSHYDSETGEPVHQAIVRHRDLWEKMVRDGEA